MLGDYLGRFGVKSIVEQVLVTASDPRVPGTFTVPANFNIFVRVPFATSGAYKIADNESPRPQDRVFLNFNYFNNVPGATAIGSSNPNPADLNPNAAGLTNIGPPTATAIQGPNGQAILTALQFVATNPATVATYNSYIQQALRQGNLVLGPPSAADLALAGTIIATRNPAILAALPAAQQIRVISALVAIGAGSIPLTNLSIAATGFTATGTMLPSFGEAHLTRQILGFEKTFLDGNASFGLRVPIFQFQGDASISKSDVGDITVIGKYAFINNHETGSAFVGGLALTIPTGPGLVTDLNGDTIHPWLFQPYVGGLYVVDRFYIHGFSSLVVPSDFRDTTLFFNDIGVGYTVYQNTCRTALVSAIAPTFEAHFNTPFSRQGINNQPVGVPDSIVLTEGIHFLFRDRARLTIGVSNPVTGPKPYSVEGAVQLNVLF
jgi:hypothetical protein